jgi:hypothetical protein
MTPWAPSCSTPHSEDIGARRDAGAIEQLRLAPDRGGLPGVFLDQSAGGLERPEAGDGFGAAVFVDYRVVAGAPGEDVAGRADAGMIAEYRPGLELVDTLRDEPSLTAYHLLPSVRGDLLATLGRVDEARAELKRAAELTRNERERELLLARAAAL